MTMTIITESEGLDILEASGLSNGEERQKAYYKKEGYINTGRALDAFLEKIEQVHTYAKLVINPKSKKVSHMVELKDSLNLVRNVMRLLNVKTDESIMGLKKQKMNFSSRS